MADIVLCWSRALSACAKSVIAAPLDHNGSITSVGARQKAKSNNGLMHNGPAG
jgi:hypothetical protein